MFITTPREIIEACPTAKMDAKAADKLMRSIEEEENTMMEPLLGYKLMMQLVQRYRQLVDTYGSICTDAIPTAPTEGMEDLDLWENFGKEIDMLRDIQSALVYRMFSNKIYNISTSLNLGGGANRASAGDYEPADDKHIQELKKEFWMNSCRISDNILIRLERDAKAENPLWLEAWKESESYYLKEDLLIPTMRVLCKYMPCHEPTKFATVYAPTIRHCQDTYIAPRVDDSLFDSLLDPAAELSPAQMELQKKLRVALAYYVRAKEGPRDERNEALMTADTAMSTALAYIEKHKEELFETTDDGQQTTDGQQADVTGNAVTQQPCNAPHLGNYCGEQSEDHYETFSTLFAPGLNRW